MDIKLYKNKVWFLIPLLFLSVLINIIGCTPNQIVGTRIRDHIEKQLSFGPRLPGSEASKRTADFFLDSLKPIGWHVEFQEFFFDGVLLRNVIAKNSSNAPDLIIGAHYDTRQFSDRDPDKSNLSLPVPGAIDGGSGSAIILELAKNILNSEKSIWLVFFDGEDQGKINDWQWSIGADYFAKGLVEYPKRVVILDMLGDRELKIFKEENSDLGISDEIWATAKRLGFEDNFIDEEKYAFIDDHLPFINKKIPTALLIDFDYPYWHTTSDTIDKVSLRNLEIVYKVMLEWINSK